MLNSTNYPMDKRVLDIMKEMYFHDDASMSDIVLSFEELLTEEEIRYLLDMTGDDDIADDIIEEIKVRHGSQKDKLLYKYKNKIPQLYANLNRNTFLLEDRLHDTGYFKNSNLSYEEMADKLFEKAWVLEYRKTPELSGETTSLNALINEIVNDIITEKEN